MKKLLLPLAACAAILLGGLPAKSLAADTLSASAVLSSTADNAVVILPSADNCSIVLSHPINWSGTVAAAFENSASAGFTGQTIYDKSGNSFSSTTAPGSYLYSSTSGGFLKVYPSAWSAGSIVVDIKCANLSTNTALDTNGNAKVAVQNSPAPSASTGFLGVTGEDVGTGTTYQHVVADTPVAVPTSVATTGPSTATPVLIATPGPSGHIWVGFLGFQTQGTQATSTFNYETGTTVTNPCDTGTKKPLPANVGLGTNGSNTIPWYGITSGAVGFTPLMPFPLPYGQSLCGFVAATAASSTAAGNFIGLIATP